MDAHQIFDHVSAAMKKRPHREKRRANLTRRLPVMRGIRQRDEVPRVAHGRIRAGPLLRL